jgi:hypothetical protein
VLNIRESLMGCRYFERAGLCLLKCLFGLLEAFREMKHCGTCVLHKTGMVRLHLGNAKLKLCKKSAICIALCLSCFNPSFIILPGGQRSLQHLTALSLLVCLVH